MTILGTFSKMLDMNFLKKYPYIFIFYFSLWYNNGSETAVYVFPGEETAPSSL